MSIPVQARGIIGHRILGADISYPGVSEAMRGTYYGPLRMGKMRFHPVVHLPSDYEVYDFSQGYDPNRARTSQYGVGKYAEKRPGMYLGDQFVDTGRDVHVGVDLAGPVGEGVHCFLEGHIFLMHDNDREYDYGPTIITRHEWLDQEVFALHGHLSRESLERWRLGDAFDAGARLGHLGSSEVNGGWNPHVHFQLSRLEPTLCDLPGAVREEDAEWALRAFPDPQLVLGRLY